jgi:hypothetical protein
MNALRGIKYCSSRCRESASAARRNKEKTDA